MEKPGEKENEGQESDNNQPPEEDLVVSSDDMKRLDELMAESMPKLDELMAENNEQLDEMLANSNTDALLDEMLAETKQSKAMYDGLLDADLETHINPIAELDPSLTATATAEPANPVTPGGMVRITATLMHEEKPVEEAAILVSLHYRSTSTRKRASKRTSKKAKTHEAATNADGIAVVDIPIGWATAGHKVRINVLFYLDRKLVAKSITSFTPMKKHPGTNTTR